MKDNIIDEIDALVDEQLSGYSERSGYDYNVNQQKCWHCGEDWHGLKITARMREMRDAFLYGCGCDLCQANGGVASDYRYSSDDSEVLCPGSDFIGPWATKRQIERMRSVELGYLDGGWIQPPAPSNPYTLDSLMRMRAGIYGDGPSSEALRRAALDHSFPQRVILGVSPIEAERIIAREQAVRGVEAAQAIIDEGRPYRYGEDGDPEPDTRTPQERALPRPSTTPPMWAVDAGRQRRTRTNSRRRHR